MTWTRRKTKWPWHDHLSEDEASEVRDLERRIATAKYDLAMAVMLLNPIRNRAIQRAKYAAHNQEG